MFLIFLSTRVDIVSKLFPFISHGAKDTKHAAVLFVLFAQNILTECKHNIFLYSYMTESLIFSTNKSESFL